MNSSTRNKLECLIGDFVRHQRKALKHGYKRFSLELCLDKSCIQKVESGKSCMLPTLLCVLYHLARLHPHGKRGLLQDSLEHIDFTTIVDPDWLLQQHSLALKHRERNPHSR